MNLEEIQALADKDLKLDDTELDIESLKTPELHNKYLKLFRFCGAVHCSSRTFS